MVMTGDASVIAELKVIVEAACAAETNIFGYDIWTHHILFVVDNGRKLAPLFVADEEIVEVAALLHDYASVKDASLYEEHHIHSPAEAEKLLHGFGYPEEKIQAVKYCIANHRGSVGGERRTAEAECLASADALAHIENVPSLLYLAFVRKGMGIDEGAQWVRQKLARSWIKLSPPVKEMAKEKYQAALRILAMTA
jgi:uncharacterized protein